MTIELVDYLLERYPRPFVVSLEGSPTRWRALRAVVDSLFEPEYHQLLDDSVFYALFYLEPHASEVRRPSRAVYEESLALVEERCGECMDTATSPQDDARELAVTLKALEEATRF